MFENRVFRANEALGEIMNFISSDQHHVSIYKKEKDGDGSTIGQVIESVS